MIVSLNVFRSTSVILFAQDLRGAIQKVSSFLQSPLTENELSSCVKHCSFSSMKDNQMVNYTLVPAEIMDPNKGAFMRKGGNQVM